MVHGTAHDLARKGAWLEFKPLLMLVRVLEMIIEIHESG
jgi:hypothetical protein